MNGIVFKGTDKSVKMQKIRAVKLIKEITGLMLKEAKDFIDSVDKGNEEIIYVNRNFTTKSLEYYIEGFRDCGYICSNNRKEKINNLIQSDYESDSTDSKHVQNYNTSYPDFDYRYERLNELSDKIFNVINDQFLVSVTSNLNRLEKKALISIISSKIEEKIV